jgi:AraC family transcriptional regulator, regulatory protein of adaptative response / methylated-DNA-[protein]-cysteine methyltransferase
MTSEFLPRLDREACDRARLARDPAHDGKFFTGVRTTRIYCRPVCPVRPAKSRNVTFFPTAAAAERAGFRPCLRCRPETAPGSPAWSGTASTVARGLRLIDEGFLDRASVAMLAEKLGVGPRHLLRLFVRHAGATPSEVAATGRVQRAKRLIDQTPIPLSDVAFAAGFASVRRFNDAFRATSAGRRHRFARGPVGWVEPSGRLRPSSTGLKGVHARLRGLWRNPSPAVMGFAALTPSYKYYSYSSMVIRAALPPAAAVLTVTVCSVAKRGR